MPNVASVLKDEIARLAKKEIRKEIENLRKASAQYRLDIAALKRRVAELEKLQGRLEKKEPKTEATEGEAEPTTRLRFSAKRFSAMRRKLELSAAEMGILLGVSAQTVYNWEAGKSRPRQPQMVAVAAIRKITKKQAKARLAAQAD